MVLRRAALLSVVLLTTAAQLVLGGTAPALGDAERSVVGAESNVELPSEWVTWGLRRDGVGYALEIEPRTASGSYSGRIVFHFQNGTTKNVVKLALTVDPQLRVRLLWPDGKRSRGNLSLKSDGYPETLLELGPACLNYLVKRWDPVRTDCWFYPAS